MILNNKTYKPYGKGGVNMIPNNQEFSLTTAVTLIDYDWDSRLPHSKAYYFGDNTTSRILSTNITGSGSIVFSFYVRMQDHSEPTVYPNSIPDFEFGFLGSIGDITTIQKKHVGSNIWRMSIQLPMGNSTGIEVFKSTAHSTKSFYLYGYQVEPGNNPEKYTPTNGTAAINPFPEPLQAKDASSNFGKLKLLHETAAIFERAKSEGFTFPNNSLKWKMNDLIKNMIADGYWHKQDTHFNFAYNNSGLANFSRINWKNPFSVTNLVTHSVDWGSTTWGSGGSTKTSNSIMAPNGTMTGCLIDDTTANSETGIPQKQNIVANSTIITYSIYTKAGSAISRNFLLRNTTTATNFSVGNFNYILGQFNSGGVWSSIYTGDGWYRLSYSQTTNISIGDILTLYYGRTSTSTGNTNSWYVWGAQVEDGNKASQYVATGANPIYGNGLASVHGGMTYTSEGWRSNGVDGYINLHYNPAQSGKNYTAANAGFGIIGKSPATGRIAVSSINGTDVLLQNLNSTIQRVNNSENLNSAIDLSGDGYKYICRNSQFDGFAINNSVQFPTEWNSPPSLNSSYFLFQKSGSQFYEGTLYAGNAGAALTYEQTQNFRQYYNEFLSKIGLNPIA